MFGLMAGAVAVLAVFVTYERWRSRTVGSPLVALSLFGSRSFSAGLVVWLIFSVNTTAGGGRWPAGHCTARGGHQHFAPRRREDLHDRGHRR
jgi:hypothetical protein